MDLIMYWFGRKLFVARPRKNLIPRYALRIIRPKLELLTSLRDRSDGALRLITLVRSIISTLRLLRAGYGPKLVRYLRKSWLNGHV